MLRLTGFPSLPGVKDGNHQKSTIRRDTETKKIRQKNGKGEGEGGESSLIKMNTDI